MAIFRLEVTNIQSNNGISQGIIDYLCLAETFPGITTSRMRHIHGKFSLCKYDDSTIIQKESRQSKSLVFIAYLDSDIVFKRNVIDFDILVGPISKYKWMSMKLNTFVSRNDNRHTIFRTEGFQTRSSRSPCPLQSPQALLEPRQVRPPSLTVQM